MRTETVARGVQGERKPGQVLLQEDVSTLLISLLYDWRVDIALYMLVGLGDLDFLF